MSDETLFSDALAIVDPVARATFLDRECPDPTQRQRVVELLVTTPPTVWRRTFSAT